MIPDTDIAPGRAAPLPKWRLQRAFDYVDANVGRAVALPDLARSAGLSRMHFARQFRSATGLRPHQYILQRRIEHAKQLLLVQGIPPVEVALRVGFRSQAHFTNVFRALVGQPPGAWRACQSREFTAAVSFKG
jgi:AraC family transcriptional regulator